MKTKTRKPRAPSKHTPRWLKTARANRYGHQVIDKRLQKPALPPLASRTGPDRRGHRRWSDRLAPLGRSERRRSRLRDHHLRSDPDTGRQARGVDRRSVQPMTAQSREALTLYLLALVVIALSIWICSVYPVPMAPLDFLGLGQ